MSDTRAQVRKADLSASLRRLTAIAFRTFGMNRHLSHSSRAAMS